MNLKLLLLTFLTFTLNFTNAQHTLKQYFDGADTLGAAAIIINIDTTGGNTWQVGPPQKTIFDSPATAPNVIMTDTINTYPVKDTSSFVTGFNTNSWYSWLYKVAFRWKQKLDLDTNYDGGIVEYSIDTGATWHNVFNNPSVFNFYGYDSLMNKDTLENSLYAFSGTDTTWRDIWLCFDGNVIHATDSFMLRFTLISDSVDNNREGWMIDNMLAEPTYFHTVNKVDPEQVFLVYPTISTGIVKINAGVDVEMIEVIQIVNVSGKVLKELKQQSRTVILDLKNYPAGNYFIRVGTEKKAEIHKVMLTH